jgi:hypothetical protein
MDEPKTRREKKGRDKQNPSSAYSSKHIRMQEQLQSLRQIKTQDTTPSKYKNKNK